MIITNARVFDGRKFIKEDTVYAENGVITDVCRGTRDKKAIDAGGLVLAPGLIDIHTHGADGVHFLDIKGRADLEKISTALALTGTTSAVIAGFYSEDTKEAMEVVSEYSKGLPGASILGLYLEGPFINPEKRGMISPGHILKGPEALNASKYLKKHIRHMRLMTVAPECKTSAAIAGEFASMGVITAFGHSMATYEETKKAISKGIRHATHLFTAMRGIHHREPGPVPAFVESQGTTVELIADGNHIHPSVLSMAFKAFGPERIILITDSTGMKETKDGSYYSASIGSFTVKDGSSYGPDGRLLGSNTKLAQMCRNMIKWAGATTEQALMMGTANPAALLGIKSGRIIKGMPADLIICDDRLKIESVYISGMRIK